MATRRNNVDPTDYVDHRSQMKSPSPRLLMNRHFIASGGWGYWTHIIPDPESESQHVPKTRVVAISMCSERADLPTDRHSV